MYVTYWLSIDDAGRSLDDLNFPDRLEEPKYMHTLEVYLYLLSITSINLAG